MSVKCKLLTLWYTLRYPSDGLFKGLIVSGCDFKGTGKVHGDHWEMKCQNCDIIVCSEVRPVEEPKR
jgi:hypothetical protein